MRRAVLLVGLLALAFSAPGIGNAAPRQETKPYVAGDVNVSGPLPGGLANDCSGVSMSLGGSCFVLQADDKFAQVTISDSNTTKPCGVAFWSDAAVPLTNGAGKSTPFNTSSAKIAVPTGAAILWVNVPLADGVLPKDNLVAGDKCFSGGANGPGTTGTITVTFSSN